MEGQACQAQLNATNISYKKGWEAMMDLMAQAAQEYDGGIGSSYPIGRFSYNGTR